VAEGITNSSSTTEIEQIENGEGDSLTAHWSSTPIRRLETWRVASRDGQCSASDQGRADRSLSAWRRRTGACLLPADGEKGSQGGSRMGVRHRRGRAEKRKVELRQLLVAGERTLVVGGRRAAGRGSRRVGSRGGGAIRPRLRVCDLPVCEGRATEGISAWLGCCWAGPYPPRQIRESWDRYVSA
jgi:hypothetical protein